MNDKNDRTPWWLVYLSPSIIPMLPFIVLILCGLLIAVFLPLVSWIREWFGP